MKSKNKMNNQTSLIKAATILAGTFSVFATVGQMKGATITVNADQVLHTNSPYLTGACIEDVNHEVYGGIDSQMIFGESFAEPAPQPPLQGFNNAVSGMWRAFRRGTPKGGVSVEEQNPFVGHQSQQLTFTNGNGAIGIEKQGLNRWGMYFI